MIYKVEKIIPWHSGHKLPMASKIGEKNSQLYKWTARYIQSGTILIFAINTRIIPDYTKTEMPLFELD